MLEVFYNVVPIFLIAFIGSVIRKKWIRSNDFWRGLEKLSFYILFPAVLFEHISKLDTNETEMLRLVVALILETSIIGAILLAYQSKKQIDKVYFTSMFQGGTRYNNYIFFALGAALFGDEGLAIISGISPYMIVFTNTASVIIFAVYAPQNSESSFSKSLIVIVKTVITNPFVIVSVVGFSCNYFDIVLNVGVERTIHSLADSALAIGIIIVGASLKFSIAPEHVRLVAFTSMIKLILTPIITVIVLWIMAINGTPRSVAILFSCMPCASSAYILSRQLGGDPDSMSAIITFSTVFSILSLSLLTYIFI